jgi:hypothetical protein
MLIWRDTVNPDLRACVNLILSGHEEVIGKFGTQSGRLVCAAEPGREKSIVQQFMRGALNHRGY